MSLALICLFKTIFVLIIRTAKVRNESGLTGDKTLCYLLNLFYTFDQRKCQPTITPFI